jgi:hypothetical protein
MLRELEMTLRHAPEDLTNREQGILYQYRPSISPETLQQMQQEIALALRDIDDLADHRHLSRSTQSNTSTLLSQLAVLWSDLYETQVDKLTRYGEVSPELNSVLSPPLARLIDCVETLIRLLHEDEGSAQKETEP